MNDSDVADFLLTHPAFFERHAELLGHIRLGNPHGTRAISLPERQIEMLREKNRQLERRWTELVRYGHENDGYSVKCDQWSARLLAESQPERLPDAICDGLREIFEVPQAALRLWQIDAAHAALPAAASAGPDVPRFTDSLSVPYCGANSGFAAAAWLAGPPETPETSERPHASDALETRSIALVPLRAPGVEAGGSAFGLLVLGSPDPQRFHEGMATDFLIRIGVLASAALSRLLPR